MELKNMGQQSENGRYPIHFHMCGDVDQRGGYWEPTYVDGLSIHHSFSRCLTIHATNGLLVSKECANKYVYSVYEDKDKTAGDILKQLYIWRQFERAFRKKYHAKITV